VVWAFVIARRAHTVVEARLLRSHLNKSHAFFTQTSSDHRFSVERYQYDYCLCLKSWKVEIFCIAVFRQSRVGYQRWETMIWARLVQSSGSVPPRGMTAFLLAAGRDVMWSSGAVDGWIDWAVALLFVSRRARSQRGDDAFLAITGRTAAVERSHLYHSITLNTQFITLLPNDFTNERRWMSYFPNNAASRF